MGPCRAWDESVFCIFSSKELSGKNADEAFEKAVKRAQWERGHGGYTGTIAEKHEFVIIKKPVDVEASLIIYHMINDRDPRIYDKWGPAGCIDLGDNKYCFFGWASC